MRMRIEHQLPIKESAKLIKQTSRRIAREVMELVQKEIQEPPKARFIRTSRYIVWISNIVSAKTKNEKIRIYIDFQDLTIVPRKMSI